MQGNYIITWFSGALWAWEAETQLWAKINAPGWEVEATIYVEEDKMLAEMKRQKIENNRIVAPLPIWDH